MDEGIKIGAIILVIAVIITVGGVWFVQKKLPKE